MVTSKFYYLSVLFLFFFQTGTFGQKKASARVLATELNRFDAMIRQDSAALSAFLADDLLYIHSNAMIEHKLEHLQSVASGHIRYQSMQRQAATVRMYGKIAVCTGTVLVKGIISGNPFEVSLLYTSIYRKKKAGWLLVNWQSTRQP